MKIAAAQISLLPDIEANRKKIIRWIEKAAEQRVAIMNFPETALSGYLYEDFRVVKQEEIADAIESVAETVTRTGTSAIVGAPLWFGKELYNSVVVLLADGRRFHYHKQNLVSFEQEFFHPGKETLLFALGPITFGCIICRDQNFPLLAKKIKDEGARVMFISCAHYYPPAIARLKVEKNRAMPIARAVENDMLVCKANAVGSYRGEINLGHSIIIGPNGVVLAEAGEHEETLLEFDVDENIPSWSWKL